ncbi:MULTISPECIES: alpha/beta fold hydrolase [Gordonia]|uniref:Alpha/beta fold hydrolase n=1 Tax=Gordonia hongkongensis TaxID=1701090 RepID=A0ABT6C0H8_9ACTN|nr:MULTISPECIES: alpha/beta hydrolase [Gordonia]MBN0972793.1 alpha/beta fold hydrolase [Gordonia sp. BP-119]MBN0983015.1 alpha/beta fold hydrolase [Gordonia sp. BP-94]MDF6103745.1 alpha/beta fold hydrolase [Gordonia hongkongensis]
MPERTIDDFAATPDGAMFFARYDSLARRSCATPLDIETPFGTTRVNDYGQMGAPPVVLLPGGGATSMSWVNVVHRLAQTRRVHAVDLIGDAGRSRVSRPPQTMGELVEWLSAVLDGLGVARVDLAGHSYGAMISLAYAVGPARERVGRLALVDPTSCFTGLRPAYLLRALPILLSPDPRRQRRFLRWETRAAALDPGWHDMYCAGARFPTPPTVVPKRPTREALSRLDGGVSATVILAPDSRAHKANVVARRVRELLPSATVAVLGSGTHHTLPLEPADELADALVDALDDAST